METFTQGQPVTVDLVVRNQNGVLTDATVVVSVRAPDCEVTTASVVHDSTGLYHFIVIPDEPGQWWWEADASGGVVAVGDGSFLVTPSMVAV